MRIAFAVCWLLSTSVLVVLPYFVSKHGRDPSSSYPLAGANNTSIKHTYLVYPKVHHSQFSSIRKSVSYLREQIGSYAHEPEMSQQMRDSLIDYANPIQVMIMPPVKQTCLEMTKRYSNHEAALARALGSYAQDNKKFCIEIVVTVIDLSEDQHLEFRAVRRETGRSLILNEEGGPLAQIILWRDDYAKTNTAQVQMLDPNQDIGSGLSILPLDWPRLEVHHNQLRSIIELRVPHDSFVKNSLKNQGLLPWKCNAERLGLRYRDSWGRLATSQWCYGDAFPKIIENDHYYAFRVED